MTPMTVKRSSIGRRANCKYARTLIGLSPDWVHGSNANVDRILRGNMPADLPVQAPSKFKFVLNLRTAKALESTRQLPLCCVLTS
jgi:hypothetical protein